LISLLDRNTTDGDEVEDEDTADGDEEHDKEKDIVEKEDIHIEAGARSN
jgi:hypothetical protein